MTSEQAIKAFQKAVVEGFGIAAEHVAERMERFVLSMHVPIEGPEGQPFCLQHRPPVPWPCEVSLRITDQADERHAKRES